MKALVKRAMHNALSKERLDTVTILVCEKGKLATKRFLGERGKVIKIAFNAGYQFGVMKGEVSNIRELSAILSTLEKMPEAFIIRGQPLPNVDLENGCRRLKENFQTPVIGRSWALIDFDNIELTDHIDLVSDPVAAMEYLIAKLPKEFHQVSYHWQLSSSAGMTKSNLLSAHIWFWFSLPITDGALRIWAKSVNDQVKYKLVDSALYRDVQPHYTAEPIFENVENPFPVRSGLVKKVEAEVVLHIPEVAIQETKTTPTPGKPRFTLGCGTQSIRHAINSGGSKYEVHLSNIGDHPGGSGFHEPIIRAIASYVASHGKDDTDTEYLYNTIADCILQADSSQHPDKNYIDHMASRVHIIPAIKTAILKFGDLSTTRKKPRLLEGIAPPGRHKRLSVAAAYALLAANIGRWC